ncbi:MAG TPA: tetratricopeptide repeat protein [Casimicrobiaceae bacterium]
MSLRHLLVAFAFLAATTVVNAVGNDEAKSKHPDWEPAMEAIRGKEWTVAIDRLQAVVRNEPDNADAQNWLAYAYRKQGNLPRAFEHYRIALKLDPEHRGAHEYIGEAYLAAGDKAKAREHLAILARLCKQECEEYRDLAKAIAAAP